MKRTLVLLLSMSLLLSGCGQQGKKPSPITGQFDVVPEESNINFTSIKNQDIGVSGFFDEISGSVTVPENGNVNGTTGEITLTLTSLNTGLKVRDDRVLKHFFETDPEASDAENSTAVFQISSLDSQNTKKLSTLRKSVNLTVLGKLSLHGETVKQSMTLKVTRTAPEEVRVTTRKPYVFNVKQFNMLDPLEKLMEVCGHKDVSMAVPIDVNLTLRQS